MRLTHLGTESGEDGCPSMFLTDRTHDGEPTVVVQGWRVTDPEAIAEMQRRGLPDHETAVEIPLRLLKHSPAQPETGA
ncbi:hypothetical protein GCM10010174_70320 [Kutzneria viridogrisea]|uniref:Uncharacterized protein n=1 Tax=Kutzneria viridogrisea TaxID=47990 RepID=A0ABR6BB69_9PSEU|nr:hypothetical protein [Kutzneria viridogrisea]